VGRLAQLLDRLPARGGDLRVAVVPELARDDPDPQAGRLGAGKDLPEQDAAQQAAVLRVPAKRAGDDRGRLWNMVAEHRRAPKRRLEAGEPAVSRRIADRADAVRPNRAAHQPGCDRGAGPAGRAARATVRVPRIPGWSIGGDVAGAAGAVLVHVRDPDD